MFKFEDFDLVHNFLRVGQCFRHIRKDGRHFLRRLQPLLLGVMQAVRIVHLAARAQADKPIMGLGMFLLHEMHIVGGNHLRVRLRCKPHNTLIHNLLMFIHHPIPARLVSLMTLEFQIIVIAKEILEPENGLFCLLIIVIKQRLGHLPRQTGRRNDQSFMVLLQQLAVDTGTGIETVCPSAGNDFTQVMVACLVFGQKDQVIAAGVLLVFLHQPTARRICLRHTGHIRLTAEDRLEDLEFQLRNLALTFRHGIRIRKFLQLRLFLLEVILYLLIMFIHKIEILLDAEHIPMVRYSHGVHAHTKTLRHQIGNLGHSIQN